VCSWSSTARSACFPLVVCCGSISGLVFMSELLRVCLVLKIILMLYRFTIRLNFSETLFKYGIYTKPRSFSSLLRQLLLLELMTESMKPLVWLLSWRSCLRLLNSFNRLCCSWNMMEALLWRLWI
jgi:hypothetical protein